MKRQFQIPLLPWAQDAGHLDSIRLVDVREYAMSDVYVVPATGDLPEEARVEAVRPPRRRFRPYRLYQFVWEDHKGRTRKSAPVRATRLSVFPPLAWVFVERPTVRPQVVWSNGGDTHLIEAWGYRDAKLICDDKSHKVEGNLHFAAPSCPKCLAAMGETTWVKFRVLAYDHPRIVAKEANKDRAKARTRARYPTLYDHLTGDWLDV